MLEKSVMLKHKTHIAFLGGNIGGFLAGQMNLSRIRYFQTRDHTEQSTFARTRRSQKSHQRTAFQFQADVLHRVKPVEGFIQVFDFNAHKVGSLSREVGRITFSSLYLAPTSALAIRVTIARKVNSEATAKAAVKLYSL